MNRIIDGVDLNILTILRSDARASFADISRRLGMAPSAILERIKKLESRGIIKGYEAKIDPNEVGLGLLAFVRVKAEEAVDSMAVGEGLARLPEVQEVHYVAGEDGYLIKVRIANAESLGKFLRERIGGIPNITSTTSTIVLTTMKETNDLVLPEANKRSEERRVGKEC